MKIIEAKKRWVSKLYPFCGIHTWRVTAELDDGTIVKKNVWAGLHDGNVDNMKWDLAEKLGKGYANTGFNWHEIVATDEVYLAVEGSLQNQVHKQNNVVVINTDEMRKNYQNQARTQVSTGVRVGVSK